ncbi:MAG TPA: MiaB/RimO family radical SAM methylthiotransferase [Candidatus Dormibacteraeota bacterium]|nr:MiaB/RimO family radical SAM methylthiotransferase [Candidatus Dormibacteraeota bacterium]
MELLPLSTAASHFATVEVAEQHPRGGRRPITPAVLGRAPRVHLWHIGCQMNDADREMLVEELAAVGCITEAALEDADLAVLITCAVRQNAEQKVYGKFKELIPWKRRRPGRAIALTGCMGVEHGSALLDRLPELDYLFDVRDTDGFISRLQAMWAADLDGPLALPASDRLSAFVPVIGGCNEMCSYCIVPFVRGREQSRNVDEVVDDVRRLVDRGVREVTLLGQNVNSYRDPRSGAGLAELMVAVDAVPGLWRQRFLTSHPRNASLDLLEAMRDLPTACEQLHLPVQAGDDALLRRMRRLYTVDDYVAIVERARRTVPDVAVSTDIIVGFCGESEAEFAATEALMRELRFDVVHLQAYSPRPGTAAARRADDVPLMEKKRRLNHLLDLQRRIALERNLALVGKEVEVLVEGTDGGGRHYGRTRQNKVAWIGAHCAVGTGELVRAVVREVSAWQLQAEPVAVAAA